MRRVAHKGNISVIALPQGFTPAELAGLFDEFGLVLGASLRPLPSGDLVGEVSLAPEPAVDAAITALTGRTIGQRPIKVARIARPPKAVKVKRTVRAVTVPPPSEPMPPRPAVTVVARNDVGARLPPSQVAEAIARFRARALEGRTAGRSGSQG
jgi:hypothetical protein